MDMSVKISPNTNDQQPEKAAARQLARGANSSDLDAWLEKVEALGELKRITAEVDPDLEAATITYLVGSEKSPALLFENIKGHPGHKALYNMIGCNLSRFCLMIGERPVDHPLQAVQILQQKLGRKMPPKEVPPEQAICNQNIVEGDKIDIRMFPAQRMWPLDGGMYLGTGDAVVTKCPETGRINVGTYRMMIKGPREVGVYTSPGKDAGADRDKWWKMGKPAPIAAAYGIDPLLFLVGATSLPKTESEYEYYSGIKGAPIEIEWNEGALKQGSFVIPKGAKNPYWANKMLAEMSVPQLQAIYATELGYPGLNLESLNHVDAKVKPYLPTQYLDKQFWISDEWYAENGAKAQELWNAWMLKKA